MVDPSMPWSLKGISDEAREFAKFSADESQVPVGAWLSAVIQAAAAQETGAAYHPATPADVPPQSLPGVSPPQTGENSGSASSTIERAAQFVDDFGFEPEGPARDADLIEDPALLQSELAALERRLEASQANTQENLAPLTEEIERIRKRLNELK